ncbi:MAG: hypothetical protein JWM77_2042 [Rhodospirillales bacterium]|nr:hypothetical protein [Rhodospirillales bacterium]
MPTTKEKDFVFRLAQLKRFDLPLGWDHELWFVRCFIGLVASGTHNNDPSRADVRRRCNVARDLALDGRSRFQLCTKFETPGVRR